MNKIDQLIERWRSAGSITCADGRYSWIAIDIFDKNIGLYASQKTVEQAMRTHPLAVIL